MNFIFLIVTLAFGNQLLASDLPLKTVEKVNIQNYLGTWYEIARFDHKFQKGCTATRATYSKRSDGDIKVVNECRLNSPTGELKKAIGRAWIKNKKTNAKLKVQFFLRNFKIPFLAGNYWILELDKNYQYALIGDPSRDYLWILSRTPKMNPTTYLKLIQKAESLKFNTTQLIKTIQLK